MHVVSSTALGALYKYPVQLVHLYIRQISLHMISMAGSMLQYVFCASASCFAQSIFKACFTHRTWSLLWVSGSLATIEHSSILNVFVTGCDDCRQQSTCPPPPTLDIGYPEQRIALGVGSTAVALLCVWDDSHGYGAASEPVWSS